MSFPQLPEWMKPAELKALEGRLQKVEDGLNVNKTGSVAYNLDEVRKPTWFNNQFDSRLTVKTASDKLFQNRDFVSALDKEINSKISPSLSSLFPNVYGNKSGVDGIKLGFSDLASITKDPKAWVSNNLNKILSPDPMSWLKTGTQKVVNDALPSVYGGKSGLDGVKLGLLDLNNVLKDPKYFVTTIINNALPNLYSGKSGMDAFKLGFSDLASITKDPKAWVDASLNKILSPDPATWFSTKFKLPDITSNLKNIGTFSTDQFNFDNTLKTIRDNLDKEVKGLNSTLVGKDSALGKWTTGVGGMKTDIAARMKVLKTTTDKLNAIPVKWAARMTSLQTNLDSNQKDFENDMYKKKYSKTYKYAGYGDLTISGDGISGYVADMLKHIDAALGMPTNRASQIRDDISWGIGMLSTYPAAYAQGIAKMVKSTLNDIGGDIKSLMDELTQSIKDTLKGTPMENLPDLPKSPSDVMPKLDAPPTLTPPSAPSLKPLP